jgi:hypothetical protein
MFRVQAPVIIVPTVEVRRALGGDLRSASIAAYREIAHGGQGLEMAHLQFEFHDLTLAACSRVRRDGFIEIELGLGQPGLPASRFTMRQLREAEERAQAQARATRLQPRHR